MSSGTWLNKDGLYLKFGTAKTTPNIGGSYLSYGENRVAEFLIDLTLNTNAARIVSDTFFFPAGTNTFIEKVEVVTQEVAATGTAFNVGVIEADRSTTPSNGGTAFVKALITASINGLGETTMSHFGDTYAGDYVGLNLAGSTQPYYVTSYNTDATAFTTGLVRVRIYWHGIGTIDDSAATTKY